METYDAPEKKILSNPIVFAEIANFALCNKENVIKPEELFPINPNSTYMINGEFKKLERDVLMEWRINGIVRAIIGIENQTHIDVKMPLREQCYDLANYLELYEKNPYDVPPVITIVLYYGIKRPWSARKTICRDESKIYYPKKEIIVIELGYLSSEDRAFFKGDLGVISELLVDRRNNIDYEFNNRTLYEPLATLKLLDKLSKTKNYSSLLTKEEKK